MECSWRDGDIEEITQLASLGPADGPDLAALASAAVELIHAIGFEPRNARAGRHVELLQDFCRLKTSWIRTPSTPARPRRPRAETVVLPRSSVARAESSSFAGHPKSRKANAICAFATTQRARAAAVISESIRIPSHL
jgi:hypothetical protein